MSDNDRYKFDPKDWEKYWQPGVLEGTPMWLIAVVVVCVFICVVGFGIILTR